MASDLVLSSAANAVIGGLPLAQVGPGTQSAIDTITAVVKVLFSWVLLLPIAVIVSGKLLARTFRLPRQTGQDFNIRIPGVLRVRARNEEVVLGFALFLSLFFITSVFAGKAVYKLSTESFGVDLGQFTALCVFCSFEAVILTCFLLSITSLNSARLAHKKKDPIVEERDSQVQDIAKRAEGGDVDGT